MIKNYTMPNPNNAVKLILSISSELLMGALLLLLPAFVGNNLKAQCASGVVVGQNLVTNGDFSQGYTGWTHDPSYGQFTACGNCYSVPGKIYAGKKPSVFNPGGFSNFLDHTATSDSMMLMVDGICTAGIPLWSQSNIPLSPNTTYYFEVWITTMSAPTPHGTLQFDIGGVNYATVIQPSNTIGAWTLFSLTYTTGATPPATTTISIENTETTGCNSAVDFAIDDISFTPGCAFSSVGPVPNLGPDQSICGKGGSITLNSNVPHNTTTTVTWTNSGAGSTVAPVATGTGLTAPYTTVVTAPGTYTVCVSDGGSCVKSDVIVITATYTISLGPPITLCNPVTANLDAIYTGPGVTYQWYKTAMIAADTIQGAKSRTYTAASAGSYFVKVTDPICGVQSSSVVISSNAATPGNGVFCGTAKGGSGTVSLSISGPGGTKYKWWSTPGPTGGAVLAKGTTYAPTGLTGPGPYTYYVEDTSSFKGMVADTFATKAFTNLVNVGPTDGNNGGHKSALYFNASLDFTLDTLSVLPYVYYCPPAGTPGSQYSIIISIKDNAGVNLAGSPVTYPVPNTLCVNAAPNSVPVKVPIGVKIPAGSGYQMQLAGTSNQIGLYLNSGGSGVEPTPRLYTYPTTYSVSGNPVVTIIGNDANTFNLYNSPDAYPGFFDWKITRGSACQRVPVTATETCALPLSYVSFEAMPVSGFVKLTWQTTNEVNTNYYTIEKSVDGITFSSIGTVDADANSSVNILNYSFIDRSPAQGVNYYRIKEVDQNGSAYYTSVRVVIYEENNVVVKPNPNQGNFTVSFRAGISERVNLNLINALGQVVYRFSDVSNSEVFSKVMDISEMAAGIYVLQINSGSETWVRKIIKE